MAYQLSNYAQDPSLMNQGRTMGGVQNGGYQTQPIAPATQVAEDPNAWWKQSQNPDYFNIMNSRADPQQTNAGYAGAVNYGGMTDQDKQWLYGWYNQHPNAYLGFGSRGEWNNAINDVGNTDLLVGSTQMGRNLGGNWDSYSSPFADKMKEWYKGSQTGGQMFPGGVGGAPGATGNASGSAQGGVGNAAAGGTQPGAGISNYGAPITDPSAYFNPYQEWANQRSMENIQQSAAARGNLNSGATMKALADYMAGANGQQWQNSFNNAQTDMNRMYGVANNDRNFDYNAQRDDRNFNNQNNQFLANLGMQGTQSQAQLQQLLATLTSNNSIAAAQAQGAGTMGQQGAYGTALQQMLTNWLASQYYPQGR